MADKINYNRMRNLAFQAEGKLRQNDIIGAFEVLRELQPMLVELDDRSANTLADTLCGPLVALSRSDSIQALADGVVWLEPLLDAPGTIDRLNKAGFVIAHRPETHKG